MQITVERRTCAVMAFLFVMVFASGCAEKGGTVRPARTNNGPASMTRQGSQDHPLLKRYEGAVVVLYDHKSYDSYTAPVGEVAFTPDFKRSVFSKSLQLEGDVTRVTYAIPEGRSSLEVLRNYEHELNQEGYTLLYAADGEEASKMLVVDIRQFEHADLGVSGPYRIRLWKQPRREGDVHNVLFAMNAAGLELPAHHTVHKHL